MAGRKKQDTVEEKKGSPLDEALARIRKEYGGNAIRSGDKFPPIDRVASGFWGFDYALGVTKRADGTYSMGFPRGRVSIISGQESAAKTLISIWLMREFAQREEPVVYVDAEKSLDQAWWKTNDLDPSKVMVEPSVNSEQTLNILAELIRAMPDGLIVVDSLAMLTPKAEITGSFDDWQQGLAARLNNKAFRNMSAGMNQAGNQFDTAGATVLVVQQNRTSIKTGSTRDIPGGRGQLFAASVKVDMRAGAKLWYHDGGESDVTPKKLEEATVVGRVFHFDVDKNKTAPPHRFGEFKFYTGNFIDPKTGVTYKAGSTNTYEQVLDVAVQVGVVEAKGGGSYAFKGDALPRGRVNVAMHLASNEDVFQAVIGGVVEMWDA